MTTVHILGCGPSGADYKPDGHRVIGVNDAYKWGHQLSDLLIINSPRQFTPERLNVILKTNASRFVVLESLWDQWNDQNMPGDEVITPQLMPGPHKMKKDGVYFTNNSPFVAMTYAVSKGADKVVLWGVDFEGHKYLRFEDCAPDFTRYAQWAATQGVRIYKGSTRSRLVLEIYKPFIYGY